MEREVKLQHFSHTHPLMFTEEQAMAGKEISCSGCEKPLALGPSYNCSQCNFYLHEVCAKLPFKIDHPFHRQHPLTLLPNPPSQYSDCVCDFCDKPCRGFAYHCFTCMFDLDIPCALLPPRVTGDFLELDHFSHKHQLIFMENHDNHGKEARCFGCKQELVVSDHPAYRCSLCDFFLHFKCSNLTPEINHPYHRGHSLILLTTLPPYYTSCLCDFCHKTCQGFIYHCPSCKFDLDIKCASFLPLCIIEPELHRHQFIHLMKPVLSFICDACGIKGDHSPYLCTLCQVIIHEECRFLPHTIQIIGHRHPVTQFYFLQGSNMYMHSCGICHNEVNPNYGGYCCSGCNFVAHVRCAVATSVSVGAYEGGDESFDSITDIIKEISFEGDMVAMVVKHFSHPHKLTLNEEKVKDIDRLCNGCIKPISEPFYSCLQCDLFVHKTCLELPRKKQHPLHPHPLTLLPKHPHSNGLFFCDACHQSCHGFTYCCEQCNFNLDVRCGSLLNILKHEAHEHPLVFSKGSECRDCSACGYPNDVLYTCNDCDFGLDFGCACLPETAKHKHHEHPLELTYQVQDDEDHSYCDICEEDLGRKWYFCCKACKFFAHPKCGLGQYPYIKLGETYPYEGHPHPVVFVHKTRGPPCSRSGNPCKGLALQCTMPQSQCSFIIEWCHVEILHF